MLVVEVCRPLTRLSVHVSDNIDYSNASFQEKQHTKKLGN